jgi:hypothetical protein
MGHGSTRIERISRIIAFEADGGDGRGRDLNHPWIRSSFRRGVFASDDLNRGNDLPFGDARNDAADVGEESDPCDP